MSATRNDRPLFFPATNSSEAIQRIFSLTGRVPDSSRGEKRALVALRDALRLDVDIARTNAVLGRALAAALDVQWDEDLFTNRNTVNLQGLNALLEGATEARRLGSLERLREARPEGLEGRAWVDFEPARSKIEAVTRIAALTNSPRESLGPGSKERKSVLINLADALFPDVPLNRSSKTKLGASLAAQLEVPWNDACESTGETISLVGLNMLLAGAERRLGRLGSQIADVLSRPEDEGSALTAALLDGLPVHWDGKTAVQWLADRGLRGSRDNEWQGFYGEERAKAALNRAFTPKAEPARVRYGNTTFDYSLNWVWDIKVHTEVQLLDDGSRAGHNETQLNDETATRLCIEDQGLGFLTISGAAAMDTSGEFVTWHRAFKGSWAQPSNSGTSRKRKAAFTPLFVEAFWVPDTLALEAALLGGQLMVKSQGRQAPRAPALEGAARPNKIWMQMRAARRSICVARRDWPPYTP